MDDWFESIPNLVDALRISRSCKYKKGWDQSSD